MQVYGVFVNAFVLAKQQLQIKKNNSSFGFKVVHFLDFLVEKGRGWFPAPGYGLELTEGHSRCNSALRSTVCKHNPSADIERQMVFMCQTFMNLDYLK